MDRSKRWLITLDKFSKRRDEIKKLRHGGWSLSRIAEKYDISKQRVSQIVNQDE